jgi:hypothetical protein
MARLRGVGNSEIASNLDINSSNRYKEKLLTLNLIIDPYEFGDDKLATLTNKTNLAEFPNVTYPDIYHYLIEYPALFSRQALKAYKSLEAFNYVHCGWVGDVQFLNITRTNDINR